MFKIDMDAIRDAVIEARLMANPANVANPANSPERRGRATANLATTATSRHHGAHIDPAVTELLEAAMRACDAWNDTAQAREEMRRDCWETPPHLRADLLNHFERAYPPSRKRPR